MLSQALKLVWNRRSANALVMVEIAAALVAVFVLVAVSVHLWSNYRRPLGFDYQNVWQVAVTVGGGAGNVQVGDSDDAAAARNIRTDVLTALRALPRVEAAHEIRFTPFLGFRTSTRYGADADSVITTARAQLSTGGPQALGMTVVEGRWFGPEDEGQTYRAVVVNRLFVERVFGSGVDPLGRQINHPPSSLLERLEPEQRQQLLREARVVGVVDEYRPHGELSDPEPFAIESLDYDPSSYRDLFVKVTAGTDAGFEERIIETIRRVAPDWLVSVTSWERLRELDRAERLAPLQAGFTVAGFFLVMVTLGLTGVLWQDVVRRTQEIGLRRAIGAVRRHVRRQIALEMSIVGLFGIALGTAVALQFPLLGLIQQIDWSSAPPALALSSTLVISLVLLSAAYPSWLASRREPADALRYE